MPDEQLWILAFQILSCGVRLIMNYFQKQKILNWAVSLIWIVGETVLILKCNQEGTCSVGPVTVS